MDPLQLGLAAASLVAPYLPKIGEAIVEGVSGIVPGAIQDLYRAIRGKLAGESGAPVAALDGLRQQPGDSQRVAVLAALLAQQAQADPAFARQLTRLVERASQDPSVMSVVNVVTGDARVGKIVTIRDVSGDVKF